MAEGILGSGEAAKRKQRGGLRGGQRGGGSEVGSAAGSEVGSEVGCGEGCAGLGGRLVSIHGPWMLTKQPTAPLLKAGSPS